MEAGLIFLLVVGLIFLLILGFLVYVFFHNKRKNSVRVTVIFKDKGTKSKRLRNVNDTFTLFEEKFKYDHNYEIKRKWGREIFYRSGNMNPLPVFSGEEPSKVPSGEAHAIIENELLINLFKANIKTMQNIMLFIVLGLLGILLWLVYGMTEGVTLANDTETINVIKNAVEQVMRGG